MSNIPLLTTMSPEDYAERVREQRQRVTAAAIDPGYIFPPDDGPEQWAVGMVLGLVEDTQPERPIARLRWRVRSAIGTALQRVVDAVDPTVRYE